MTLAEHIVDIILETEPDPEDLIRRSGVTVQPEDFETDEHQVGWPGGWTGNYRYHVHYKPWKVRGKPMYLGTVLGTHDYNNTRHAGLVHWYIDSVPSWQVMHTGLKRGVQRPSPFKGGPKYRKHYGYRGVVSFERPEQQQFSSLFDAEKYLLSLVKRNPRLQYSS